MKEKIYGEKIFHNNIVFEGKVKIQDTLYDKDGREIIGHNPNDAKDILYVEELPETGSVNKLYKLPNGNIYSFMDEQPINYMMNGSTLSTGTNCKFEYYFEGTMEQTIDLIDIDARNGKWQYRTVDTQVNAGTKLLIPNISGTLTIATHPGYHNYTVDGKAATEDIQTFRVDQGATIIFTDQCYLYYIIREEIPRWVQLDNDIQYKEVKDMINKAIVPNPETTDNDTSLTSIGIDGTNYKLGGADDAPYAKYDETSGELRIGSRCDNGYSGALNILKAPTKNVNTTSEDFKNQQYYGYGGGIFFPYSTRNGWDLSTATDRKNAFIKIGGPARISTGEYFSIHDYFKKTNKIQLIQINTYIGTSTSSTSTVGNSAYIRNSGIYYDANSDKFYLNLVNGNFEDSKIIATMGDIPSISLYLYSIYENNEQNCIQILSTEDYNFNYSSTDDLEYDQESSEAQSDLGNLRALVRNALIIGNNCWASNDFNISATVYGSARYSSDGATSFRFDILNNGGISSLVDVEISSAPDRKYLNNKKGYIYYSKKRIF